MNFKEFQHVLADEVKRLHPGRADVRLGSVMKNNGVLRDTLEICADGSNLYPTIYTDSYYRAYRRGTTIRRLADRVLEQCAAYDTARTLPEDFFLDFDTVAGGLYCKLIDASRNADALQGAPHRMWNDLAITVYYLVDPTILQDASIQVLGEHIEMWNADADEVLERAWKNTLRDQSPVFQSLAGALAQMGDVSYSGVEEEKNPLFLLSNQTKCFGAVCICYPELCARIGEELGSDYFIIPSSVHECLILPAQDAGDANVLNCMVREINDTQLAPQEVLSDHVYYYDRAQRRILSCGVQE